MAFSKTIWFFAQHHPRPCHALILVPRMGYVVHTSDYPDSWAYRWYFHFCVVERGLTAIPKVSLVENIGFDSDATHTFDSSLMRSSQSPGSKFKQDPSFVASILANDLAIFLIFTLTANGCAFLFPLQRYF